MRALNSCLSACPCWPARLLACARTRSYRPKSFASWLALPLVAAAKRCARWLAPSLKTPHLTPSQVWPLRS